MDRSYRIIVAISGFILLIYGLFRIPQVDVPPGILLTLGFFAAFLLQFPIKLLKGEFELVQIVTLASGFIVGGITAAWVIAIGIIIGFTFRCLVSEKRSWRRLLRINTWIKIGYKIGLSCIPLLLIFYFFEIPDQILVESNTNVWVSGLIPAISYSALFGILYLIHFLLQNPSGYPKRRTDFSIFLALELFSIPFVLLVVEIFSEAQLQALIFLGGVPAFTAYLLYKTNTAQIEHERRVRELSTLNFISQTLRSTLELDELLPVIQQQVTQLLEVNNIYVALYDRGTEELWYPLAVKNAQRHNWPRRKIADRLTDRVIQEGKYLLLTPQTRSTLAPVGLPPSEEIPTAWLGVPLISSERTIGCLAVFSIKPGAHFTFADVDVLTILSGQVSVAIENALLYHQTQYRARQLETLNQLTGAITASLDLQEVLLQVSNAIAQVVSGQRSAIYLVEPDGDSVYLAHAHGLDEAFDLRNASFSIASSRRARCLRTGQPMIIPDIQNSSLSLDLVQHFQADKIRALADLPLITPDGQIGFLSVYFDKKHDFSNEEVGILQTFASQAALAVANARLHARTDAALARRVNQLTTLEAAGRELSAATHSDRLFTLILEYALEMTNSCCGTVVIINPENQAMVVKASHGYEIADDAFPIHKGITGRVERTLRTANVADVSKDPDFYDLLKEGTKSQLSVPIIHETRLMGIISLESSEPNAYSESEEAFVTQLANQAAIDILNAELYSESQNRLQEQSALYLASTELVSAISVEDMATTISNAIDAIIHPNEIGVYLWSSDNKYYSLLAPSNHHLPSKVEDPTNRYLAKNFSDDCKNCQIFTYPLEMSEQRPGLVVLHLPEDRYINENQAELFQTILAQGSIALQNAYNFNEAKNSRDRLEAILNSIGEGILMVDIDGHILMTNNPIHQISGLSYDEFLETPIQESTDRALEALGYDRSEISSILKSLGRKQVPPTPKKIFEFREQKRTHIIERVSTPLWGHDRSIIGLMVVLRDITEEREIEQTREAITETIVHDVRSPMSAILGALELLQDTLADADDPIIEQSLLVAQRSANRVLSLTEALLDIARLQSGRVEIEDQSIDLPTLISELMIEYTALANDENVIIRNETPRNLPPIQADLDKLIRVITNLVDNAIKFSPEGGHITISAEHKDHMVAVKVIDSGPGVPTDYRDKIFERFVQVPGRRGRRRGTGLGLAFCRLTIEAHGGDIWVDENPEGGSIFTFTVPISTPQKKSQAS